METSYSTFKRLFGELSLARSFESIAREPAGKVALYNVLVNGRGVGLWGGLSRVKHQPLQVNPQSNFFYYYKFLNDENNSLLLAFSFSFHTVSKYF